MAGFFGAPFAGLTQGVSQGIGSGQEIAQKAMQIRQARMQLDEAERQLHAQSMMFANMPSPQGAPQSPMPGQPSVSMGRPQMTPQSPQGAPGAGMPPGGAMRAPPAAPPASGPSGAMQLPDTDPMNILMKVAQSIKTRNPGIDPQTLYEAVSQQVGLMKGLSPDVSAQLRLFGDMLHSQDQAANRGVRIDLGNLASRDRERGQDISHEDRVAQRNEMHWRTTYTQDEIAKRVAASRGDRARNTVIGKQFSDLMQQRHALQVEKDFSDDDGKATIDAQIKGLNGQIMDVYKNNPWLPKPSSLANPPAMPKDYAAPDTDFDAGGAPAAGGGAGVPKDLPPPKGIAEGTKAKDAGGNVVAVLKGGQWVSP